MNGFVVTQEMFNMAVVTLLFLAVVLLLFLLFRNSGKTEMLELLEHMERDNRRREMALKEDIQNNFALFNKLNNENMNGMEQTVAEQLRQVQQGLGEMRNLAIDVGGLKKILGNVKTRGILGEFQLGAILADILAPEQYDLNVATIPGSANRVEFAVKMPGENGSMIYLPIDSKFPGDCYQHLLDAKETGDRDLIERAYKDLETIIKSEARDIENKYVEVPYTTNFGIMFLPSEGLYAEVIGRGLMQTLQNDYQVSVVGPSTMAAFLNSLQMGFRTLAIQERSNEVWELLAAVKTEFVKYEECLNKIRTNLDNTNAELEKLVGARTRAINKKLKEVDEYRE